MKTYYTGGDLVRLEAAAIPVGWDRDGKAEEFETYYRAHLSTQRLWWLTKEPHVTVLLKPEFASTLVIGESLTVCIERPATNEERVKSNDAANEVRALTHEIVELSNKAGIVTDLDHSAGWRRDPCREHEQDPQATCMAIRDCHGKLVFGERSDESRANEDLAVFLRNNLRRIVGFLKDYEERLR